MIEHSLELRGSLAWFMELLVGQTAGISRVHRPVTRQSTEARLCEFISFGHGQELDGLCWAALTHGEQGAQRRRVAEANAGVFRVLFFQARNSREGWRRIPGKRERKGRGKVRIPAVR